MTNEKIFVTRSSMPPYEEYIEAIKPLWESHWLTNMGKYHQELEHKLEMYLDVPKISLTVNGHMALELAIQAFDFPEGSEIITTPFTFVSTTHAIVRNRLEPVFCDVKESDGTIDETKIEDLITPKTVAIVPVHVYGNLCNVNAIQKIADKYNLKVIYDAAHAFGVKCDGVGIGNYGDASIYSFHATKVFNTIEGGAVVCKDDKMYARMHDLKDFGIRTEEVTASVGANGKMSEFNAIMGLCNLKHLTDALNARKKAFNRYVGGLKDVKGIRIPEPAIATTRNYAYFPIFVESDYGLCRDELHKRLANNDIFARKYFYPLTADQACFKNRYKNADLKIARKLSRQVMVLPLYEEIKTEQVDEIISIIKEVN
ncbi:MAG: DegT/DnrJ/EryC1/StrS family aminotransferase [Butyrivibrio sp.]|uniref:DegT/DnrJ/EryC1/StrS family aminotransferase n=1 Tax=Butyrivibrio sp. TaxID=28121 RepID=UPI0025F86953|nr:DegT/DnrJ/EryC1/StrS family aminotransferase [Butyrivibrio sp.]MCR5770688.1 DegT/DnrJ/EryC1/StrS family aminotransferase [Butyrivibrio sp.]